MIKTMDELYMMHLKSIYDVEQQIIKALPRLAKKAQSHRLAQVFMTHLDETKRQAERLERIFKLLDTKPEAETCKGMKAMLDEAEEMFGAVSKGIIDACLIACAQQVEHYEVASYGTLAAFAKELAYPEHEKLLHETLDEEKGADRKLTVLAESYANLEDKAA